MVDLESRLRQFAGRKIGIISSEGSVYVEPEPLWKLDPKNVDESLVLDNVWRGIQWYKAYCFEGYDGFADGKKVDLLLKIFDISNLVSLAEIVELQTGTKGLIESIIKSYTWAKWELFPGPHEVGEVVLSSPNITFSATTGERGSEAKMVSARELKKDPKTQIFINGKEWEDEEFDFLPEFKVEEVRVLKNKRIAFEGLPVDELNLHDSLKKEYDSYILGEDGTLEVDSRKKYDRQYIFEKFMEGESGECIIPPSYFGKDFDKGEITRLVSSRVFADRALATFLLPYCDTPSVTGVHYVLPEKEWRALTK